MLRTYLLPTSLLSVITQFVKLFFILAKWLLRMPPMLPLPLLKTLKRKRKKIPLPLHVFSLPFIMVQSLSVGHVVVLKESFLSEAGGKTTLKPLRPLPRMCAPRVMLLVSAATHNFHLSQVFLKSDPVWCPRAGNIYRTSPSRLAGVDTTPRNRDPTALC